MEWRDRFARQAKAQLRACIMAAQHGVEIIPVWNKSNREHLIVGPVPSSTSAAAAAAVKQYGLPGTLKLSVHSDSDKFSIYAPIRRAIGRFNAGLHLKTAGTTWLEEIIGLADAGGSGLALAKEIYAGALEHVDELCAPYATVIDIDRKKLPSA